ncbi:hypothetical protein BUALT_Bualt12G0039800 [Buddleja alternifolia]|uniref:3'-5' exonuclease domain-containing protein n=1 Tax=Buddleja alternifolia TaxID=168488 RepID=A0AAV6WWZ2_9LAMI|nr:hypothetical protein BUALT_Bualt12G0039800 [Buddleja alternifolia]
MAIDIVEHHSPDSSPDGRQQTYDVSFFGDTIVTTVTADPDAATEWIILAEAINLDADPVIVGLDVEWRPPFSQRRNPVAVLQICVGDRCLVYQIIHAHYIPDVLRDFFFNDSYTFVGVGVKSDLEKLVADYEVGRHANAVELGKAAADAYGRSELQTAGLKELARVVLGKNVEKPRRVTLSNWDERWLTAEQVKYACVDAFVSYEIGRMLNASFYDD